MRVETHTHTRTLISVITLDSAASGDANANTIDGPANTLTHARALAHTSEKKPPSIMSLPLKFVTVDYLSVSIIKAEMMNVFALFWKWFLNETTARLKLHLARILKEK